MMNLIQQITLKLNKIRSIYEDLNRKFDDVMIPEEFVTIDKILLLYKDRLGWM